MPVELGVLPPGREAPHFVTGALELILQDVALFAQRANRIGGLADLVLEQFHLFHSMIPLCRRSRTLTLRPQAGSDAAGQRLDNPFLDFGYLLRGERALGVLVEDVDGEA